MNPKTVLLRSILLRLLLDIAIFFGCAGIFLVIYVGRFGAPVEAIAAHFRVLATGYLWFATMRIVVECLFRKTFARNFAMSIIVSAFLATTLLYYTLVVIGMESWARVISVDLITGYARQIVPLADALEVNLFLTSIVLVAFCATVFIASHFYLKRFDWTGLCTHRSVRPTMVTVMVCLASVSAIETYVFVDLPPAEQFEPISLTLFPAASAHSLQGHLIDPMVARAADKIEDEARAAYRPRVRSERRNLILIVVDALRPDHMSVFGYPRLTTPYLNQLVTEKRHAKTDRIRASCADSACGLTSLFTSKFLHQISHRAFGLHEMLKLHKYQVHVILGGDHSSFYGLKELYGGYDSYFDGRDYVKSIGKLAQYRYVNDDRFVVDRIANMPAWDNSPVMIQLHLMSVHLMGTRLDAFRKFQPAASYFNAADQEPANRSRVRGRSANHYDNGLLQADANIREILNLLATKGYLQNTLVVITADHGEGLGEHGFYQHTNSVYEEALRIPLILVNFGGGPVKSIDKNRDSSQVDIAPTIVHELGLPIPSTWVGMPLQLPTSREFTFFQERSEVGLLDHRDGTRLWKYWVDTRTLREYAFNLRDDPDERVNRFEELKGGSLLREWRRHALAGRNVEFDAE
jgi:glucan phosphoethanolaminetransferase (alkaline phosphatase superfamily)